MSFDILSILILLVMIIFSMVLHELAHGFVSFALGDDTAKLHGRLTFNPIKHLDLFMSVLLPIGLALTGGPIFGGAKPVPYNPNNLKHGDIGVLLVAVVGPLMNLILAFIFFGLLSIINPQPGVVDSILRLGVIVNLGFFAFNILPIPPLDGSRVIYSLAPNFIKNILSSIEKYGIFILLTILILFQGQISSLMIFISDKMMSVFEIIF